MRTACRNSSSPRRPPAPGTTFQLLPSELDLEAMRDRHKNEPRITHLREHLYGHWGSNGNGIVSVGMRVGVSSWACA